MLWQRGNPGTHGRANRVAIPRHRVVPPEAWRAPFARMAAETGLPVRELETAVAEIRAWITLIATASPS
ncbi:MAG TPA: hypothetical protein VF142_08185 [Longimicrobium sp.]